MGREVKRVPMDFDWPDAIWEGYLNPWYKHRTTCPDCGGTGYSPEGKRLCDEWNDGWKHNLKQEDVDALVAEERLIDFTHRWDGNRWVKNDTPPPSVAAVNEWSHIGLGHDTLNRIFCVEAKAKRLGFDHTCKTCGGDGDSWLCEEAKRQYNSWKPHEPPLGEGWQMWETTSEGSPMSPPFETPEELARWLADTGGSSFGSDTATYDTWLNMITSTGSSVVIARLNDEIMSGVEAVSRIGKHDDNPET